MAEPPLFRIVQRYSEYLRATIPAIISEHDDMYAKGEQGALAHYFSVGRSAVELIVSAMVAAGKTDVRTVLDLPCGGGRVTRHLGTLFPEAQIFVSDLNKDKERFVVDTFDARPIASASDFLTEPERTFDLIFAGSLVTHLDAEMFKRSTSWFIRALAPDGLLVLTTHGRRHAYLQRSIRSWIAPEQWETARQSWLAGGFGYVAYENYSDYGLSSSSPSWVIRLVEHEPTTRIVSFQEGGWDDHQDALVVQKRALDDEDP